MKSLKEIEVQRAPLGSYQNCNGWVSWLYFWISLVFALKVYAFTLKVFSQSKQHVFILETFASRLTHFSA